MRSHTTVLTGFVLACSMVLSIEAVAAKGIVTWTNPPQNKGKITREDDGSLDEYQYNVNAGDTNPQGWEPSVGTRVEFTEGPGNTASDVVLSEEPGGDPTPPGGGVPPIVSSSAANTKTWRGPPLVSILENSTRLTTRSPSETDCTSMLSQDARRYYARIEARYPRRKR